MRKAIERESSLEKRRDRKSIAINGPVCFEAWMGNRVGADGACEKIRLSSAGNVNSRESSPSTLDHPSSNRQLERVTFSVKIATKHKLRALNVGIYPGIFFPDKDRLYTVTK